MINQTVEWACRYQISADLSRRQLATQQPREMPLLMLFVGSLTLFIPDQKSKVLRQKKLRRNHFPLNCNQSPKSDQNNTKRKYPNLSKFQQHNSQSRKRHRQSRYADGANSPNPDSAKATN